jgi:hypothetical protein
MNPAKIALRVSTTQAIAVTQAHWQAASASGVTVQALARKPHEPLHQHTDSSSALHCQLKYTVTAVAGLITVTAVAGFSLTAHRAWDWEGLKVIHSVYPSPAESAAHAGGI